MAACPEILRLPLRVGALTLEGRLAFAPLSGVSDLPARLIAREAGAALVFAETVGARALLRGAPAARRKLTTAPAEAPVAVQLFGARPEDLGAACERLADAGAIWVDLNLGCPVRKFLRQGAGAALMREPTRVAACVRAMRRSFPGVLSVKMRAGWDAASRNAPEVARATVAEGAQLVTVHGRTRAQQYRGRADRGIVREVVAAVPGVPVLANGDVRSAADAERALAETGAAGVMIGRGAVGNPWIFAAARGGPDAADAPPRALRLATFERHVELLAGAACEPAARTLQLRRYAAAYSKGLPGGARFRARALALEDPGALVELARGFLSDGRRAA